MKNRLIPKLIIAMALVSGIAGPMVSMSACTYKTEFKDSYEYKEFLRYMKAETGLELNEAVSVDFEQANDNNFVVVKMNNYTHTAVSGRFDYYNVVYNVEDEDYNTFITGLSKRTGFNETVLEKVEYIMDNYNPIFVEESNASDFPLYKLIGQTGEHSK